MAEFYDTPKFIVKKMSKIHNRPNDYEILTEKGNRVAEIVLDRKSLFFHFIKAIGIGGNFPVSLTIKDMKNRAVVMIKKPYTSGLMKAQIFDELVRPAATIVQGYAGKLKMEGYKIEILDPSGKMIGQLKGDWHTWMIQLLDADGNMIGKLTKGSKEVNRVLFPDDNFMFFHLYIPINNEQIRKILMGLIASIDILMT
jgi:hypothetical protein